MDEMKFCQSCGILLESADVYATNTDGSINQDYCIHCYKDGDFTVDCTMKEMIEVSVIHMDESGMLKEQSKTKDEAREFMYTFFPDLKRWKCTDHCIND